VDASTANVHASQTAVGLVGLGRMGGAICARLVRSGVRVTATDLRPERRETALRAGAAWSANAAGVAPAGAGIVITSLPGDREIAALAPELTAAMAPGSLWIEMSSATHAAARAVAPHAAERGIRLLDAPVGGSPDAATAGRLLTLVGGSPADVEDARPLLARVADRIVHVGPAGSGYTVKLVANALWFAQAAATAEALALAVRAGLDPEVVRGALAQGAAASSFLSHDAPRLLAGDDLASFSLRSSCEQLDSVVELGAAHEVPLAMIEAARDLHRAALARYGERDGELLGARYVAERAGVRLGPG
jgi:3-hydroxyisobutyrate dehydrogenase